MEPDLQKTAEMIIEWAEEKKAEKISLIDVKTKSEYTDAIIICEGMNQLHLQAIADNMMDKARDIDLELLAVEGYENATWILLDFIDIIVHIFNRETRSYYHIEDLWNVTPRNKTRAERENGQN
ncbi:MAG: ribosome silencing factor [Candidatus Cloacimonetes bacterium]|nr:ribosome silencing factor [Candidatus Cloacimonadota bacterium]